MGLYGGWDGHPMISSMNFEQSWISVKEASLVSDKNLWRFRTQLGIMLVWESGSSCPFLGSVTITHGSLTGL